MSARAEGAFTGVLRDVERQLALPIPDRIRILRELEYDLEALSGRFLAEGLSPEDAIRRALEALVPDSRSLGELGRLHAPLYRRMTRHLSAHRLRLLERCALVGITALVLVAQASTLVRADLLRNPSPFLLPVLGSGALLLGMVLAKGFQLWVKGDHTDPSRGLRPILAGSGAVLALGIGGVIVDLYRLAAVLERSPEQAGILTPDWLVRDSALLSVAIILALAGGLAWLVFSHWVSLVSGARLDLLGPNPRVRPFDGRNRVQ